MSSVDVSVVARSVRIIVPFYRSPGLVAPLFRSLLACAAELNELGCTVVAINDSPDDGALASALDSAAGELSRAVSCSLRTNRTNTGFLRTVNTAMAEAVAGGHDVILLNSDTVVFPGAFREMIRVARLDAMTGFVSPRSNNATICTFPLNDGIRTSPPHYSYQAFLELRDFLPEYHYVP